MKRILFMAALLVLSACAPAAPTVDPAQIQASAIAAASTMIAMTQAAIPTPTPTLPPSPTPLPSPTFQPLPTLDLSASPTVAVAGGTAGNPCDDPNANPPMAAKPAGTKTTLKIQNETKASVTLSLWLYKTPFGECGWRSYNLGAHATMTVTDLPQGCYFAGALINNPQKPSKAFGDQMCINTNDTWTMLVGTEVVRLTAP
jgi:hypothetical protein